MVPERGDRIDVLERMQPAMLNQIQEKYKIYLSYQLFVLDHKPEAFEILLALLPELQDIGRRHLQFTKMISMEILPHAKEPVLLADVFNLTKEKDIKKLTKI